MVRRYSPQMATRQSFSMRFDNDLGEQLREFAAEVKEKVLRPAAYAMAVVFYREMKLRAPVYTGTLRDAIYHWHDDKRSNPNRQIYVIGPNKVKAPHWHWVEYGNRRTVAHPYIRPTYDAKVQEAVSAGLARMKQLMQELRSHG
jgi:HK97 gp10 family phage protein